MENDLISRGALLLALDAVEANQKAQQWVSVKNRLPEKSGEYLTLNAGTGHYAVLNFSAAHHLFNAYDHTSRKWALKHSVDVTHWMPLPHFGAGMEDSGND